MKGYEWCNFEWDKDTFPDPAGMLKRYKERGLHICVWINSYIGQKSALFDEGMEHGYFVKNLDGSVWQCDRWQAGMALVDFTNSEACKWYQSKLERLIDMGVDCFKTDFGERIPVTGVQYYDGSDTVKMHNYYAYLYNKTVFELLERRMGRDKAVVFARSTAAGGQKFPVHWGGDCTATYPSMAEDLRGGLSLSHAVMGSGATILVVSNRRLLQMSINAGVPLGCSVPIAGFMGPPLTGCPGCSTRKPVMCLESL